MFEIVSKGKIKDFKAISDQIWQSCLGFLGELGTGKAGIWVLPERFNEESQKGIMKVNNKFLDETKASLALIQKINGQDVIVKTIGVSGSIKKATQRYFAS